VDKLANVNVGQTVTVQEGNGVVASRAYESVARKPVTTKGARVSAQKR